MTDTTTQSEALKIARDLDDHNARLDRRARNELRRQHAEIDRLKLERNGTQEMEHALATAQADNVRLRQELICALEREKVAMADAERLNHLQMRGATVEVLPGKPWAFRVGGLLSSKNTALRASIDAAINQLKARK